MTTNEPLGLPDGTVRALLALIIVIAALAIYAFTDKLSFGEFLGLTGTPTGLYFGQYVTTPGTKAA